MWSFDIVADFDKGLGVCEKIFASQKSPYVFSHPALLKAWCDTYKPIRRLDPVFITGKTEDGNEMSFPMVLWHRNWKNAFLKMLIPIGYSDFDYHDPIFKKPLADNDIQIYWSELKNFLIRFVKFDEIAIDGITDRNKGNGDGWTQGEICPMLSLNGLDTEDDLMKFFRTSLRGDIRRQIRRLSELGEVRMVEYQAYDVIPKSTFTTFMEHHSMRWPNAYKAPLFHDNLLKYGLKEKCVHFSALMAGEKEVAWHLGFEYAGRFYYYMPAGHQSFLRFSPAKIHLYFLVKRAIENGLAVFDHLRGEENYKDGWSNDAQYVNNYILELDTMSTQIKNNILKIRGIILPPPINTTQDINPLRNAS